MSHLVHFNDVLLSVAMIWLRHKQGLLRSTTLNEQIHQVVKDPDSCDFFSLYSELGSNWLAVLWWMFLSHSQVHEEGDLGSRFLSIWRSFGLK